MSSRPERCSLKWMTPRSLMLVFVALLAISIPAPAGAQSFNVLHSFTGASDGFYPQGLAIDRAGNLYGATLGGSHNQGAIFKLTNRNSIWTLSPLYSFAGGTDGAFPVGLTVGSDGRLYGATNGGGGGSCGSGGCGTVFRAAPPPAVCRSTRCPWSERVLYVFQGGRDGALPYNGDLLFDAEGNLYGTTSQGGGPGPNCEAFGCGTVFELSASNGVWTETVLYAFLGSSGASPFSGVIFDQSGNLYGTTGYGGPVNAGSVYQLVPTNGSWAYNPLYNFTGLSDGLRPSAGLVMDPAGNLYGATVMGGPSQGGTVYELSSGANWTFNTLYGIRGSNGGPSQTLARDAAGNFYGANSANGAFGFGSVFKLSPANGSWIYTSLYDFTGGADGRFPNSKVVIDSQGNLYGSTASGGIQNGNCSSGCGVVWKIEP